MATNTQTSRRLRVLVFNRSYYPDVEATGQLLTELCSDLAKSHALHVVAGQPNFVTTEAQGLIERDSHQGVTITRVRNFRFSKKSLIGRIVGLLSYLILAFWVGLRSSRPDVILVETDPPVLGILGVILKRWHGCRLIYYLQDLYPEVGLALGKMRPGVMTKVLFWATQVGLRGADRVIVLGKDMRAKVVSRGIPAAKTEIIPNWADTNLIFPQTRTCLFDDAVHSPDEMVVMYSGNLGLSQNLEQLLEVAHELHDQPVRFVVVGEGAAKESLLSRAQKLGLKNVRFFTYQAKERLGESLSAAHVHFIPLRQGLAGAIVPSKLYGILAAGRPFVAAVDAESEVAQVAFDTGSGMIVSPDSTSELSASLMWCLANRESLTEIGLRGRVAAETKYSRLVCVRKVEQLITSLV